LEVAPHLCDVLHPSGRQAQRCDAALHQGGTGHLDTPLGSQLGLLRGQPVRWTLKFNRGFDMGFNRVVKSQ
jgi:hypothetical protein